MSAAPSLDPAGHAVPAPPALGADAAHALFERHAGALYGYCLNRLGGREEAEDAVQTTFLNAFRALRRGVVPEFEAAWLYKIAENVCRERYRAAGRRLEVVQDPSTLADTAPAAGGLHEELFELGPALERLAPRQRRALLLREWRGLSYREIGRELRLSPAAVETLLFRARRSLARNLQLGSLVPWLKALFGGSAAVKTAAAVGVVVASASLGGGGPVEPRPVQEKAPAVVTPATANPTAAVGGAVVPAPSTSSPRGRRTDRARGERAAATPRPARRKASLPAGAPAPTNPSAPGSGPEPAVPAAAPPAAPAPPAASPPSPPSPVATPPAPPPVQAPPPPVLPDLPPPPQLPQLLPPPPPLPELPPLPQLPLLPPPPPLPEVPELPKLPQLP